MTQTLDLSNNKLSDLPDSFAQLSNLSQLDIHDNAFAILPSVISRLKGLTVFNAQSNNIVDVTSLLDCTNLEIIDLRRNKIARLPIDLPLRLPKLRICKHKLIGDEFSQH